MTTVYIRPPAANILSREEELVIEKAASSSAYKQAPIPRELLRQMDGDFEELVYIPYDKRAKLEKLYGVGDDSGQLLRSDFKTAMKYHAFKFHKEEGRIISFPTHVDKCDGTALDVSIAPNTKGTKPWYLFYVPDVDALRPRRDDSECVRGNRNGSSRGELPAIDEGRYERMRQSEAYLTDPVPTDLAESLPPKTAFIDSVWLSPRWENELIEHVSTDINVLDLLNRDWSYAVDTGTVRYYEEKVIFPVSISRADGESLIEVSIRQSEKTGADFKPWRICYINGYSRLKSRAGQELMNWAYLGDIDMILADLERLASPEPWGFADDRSRTRTILWSYLCYTFYKLKGEAKILEDTHRQIAAFNTGLFDVTYEPIYACFSPGTGDRPWQFEAFCKAASGKWGKRLVDAFNPLPQKASFFTRKEDLLFDTTKAIHRDVDHILLDNLDRLPLNFLREQLPRNCAAKEALDIIDTADTDSSPAAYKTLRDCIERSRRKCWCKG